ncbi:type VI secretion system Vgr family protein [Tunicatimonas pelagia]|uniref:type VI secretion system Vgr family protein n=1 Tax=Tunicatimonas pelagia TaxID=931531 RepID=UPI00266609F2|nr:contractile injection system protein, VgrG/Pvc8 family [Tunicatimonas pelagia]WKN41295.1 phage baseplate assembly protein V [Tunicatimonas pelagia]
MAQQVELHVTIAGESIAPLSEVSISQDVHQHHTFEISLAADAFRDTGRAILEQSKKYIGKECHIRFSPNLFGKKQSENEFIGIVTEVRLSRLSNGQRTIILQGYSPTILLEGYPQCRTYQEMNLLDIFESTLEAIPQSLATETNSTKEHKNLPYVVQYNESNYAFLQRMAARFGEWCFYDGTQLVFGEPIRNKKIDLPLVKDLFDLDFSFKVQPVNFKVFSYDYSNSTVYESSGANSAVDNLDDYGKFALEQSEQLFSQEPHSTTTQLIAEQQELNDLAEQQKAASANSMVVMNGTSDNPFLNVGSIINITGETANEQDYGEFIITSLSHYVGSSLDYQNSFTAIPAELESPPPSTVKQPVCESQSAIVVDNNDPDKLGRVRVAFPWQSASEPSTPWIRVSQAYGGGKNHGFYFVPETDTEVMVGFEHNNPEKPFVINSLYHKDFNPSFWANNNNSTKVIKTQSGNQIHLIDDENTEKIRILHKDEDNPHNEICLEMEGNGKITITSQGDIDIVAAKSIKMEAAEDIDITAGKDLSISVGKNMVTTVKSELTQEAMRIAATAQQSVETKAGTEVTIDGSTKVAVSGGMDVKIDGGANTTVKGGANLSLEGGAVASLKGALVKIN